MGGFSSFRYFFIEKELNKVTICPSLEDTKAQCRTHAFLGTNLDLEVSYIRDVQFESGILFVSLQFRKDNLYYGYLGSDSSNSDLLYPLKGSTGLLYGRNLFYRDPLHPDSVFTTFVEDDHLLLNAREISTKTGFNKQVYVQVNAALSEAEKTITRSITVAITVIETYPNKPGFSEKIRFTPFHAGFESSFVWPIESDVFLGNGLKFSWDHQGEAGPFIQDETLHTNPLTIELDSGEDKAAKKIRSLKFIHQTLVGVTKDQRLVVYLCDRDFQLTLKCKLHLAEELPKDANFNGAVTLAGSISEGYHYAVVSGAYDILFMFSRKWAGIQRSSNLKKVLSASGFLANIDKTAEMLGYVALVEEGKRVIIAVQKKPNGSVDLLPKSIDVSSTENHDDFCPTKVHAIGNNRIWIASPCRNDPRVYEYDIANYLYQVNDAPLTPDMDLTDICFYDNSVLLAGIRRLTKKTEFYLSGVTYNLNSKEEYGHREYDGVPLVVSVQCLDNAGLFAVSYPNPAKTVQNYDIYYTKASGRASKRMHSTIRNVKGDYTLNAVSNRIVLTKFEEDGSISAYSSVVDGPLLRSSIKSPASSMTELLGSSSLTLTDFKGKQVDLKTPVSIVPQNYTLVFRKKTTPSLKAGSIKFEDIIELGGPVDEISLDGASDSIFLTKAVYPAGSWDIPKEEPSSFEFLWTRVGNYLIGARQITDSLQSFASVDIFIDAKHETNVKIPIVGRLVAISSDVTREAANAQSQIFFYALHNPNQGGRFELRETKSTHQYYRLLPERPQMLVAKAFTKDENEHNIVFVSTATSGLLVYSYGLHFMATDLQLVLQIPNVYEFHILEGSDYSTVKFLYAESLGTEYKLAQIEISADLKFSFKETKVFTLPKKVGLLSLECTGTDADLHCLSNTAGIYILEIHLDLISQTLGETFYHLKYKDSQVQKLVYMDRYIAATTSNGILGTPGNDLQLWVSGKHRGKGQKAWSLPLPRSEKHDLNTPIIPLAIIQPSAEKSELILAIPFLTPEPSLKFMKTSELGLTVVKTDLEGKNLKLIARSGASEIEIELEELFDIKVKKSNWKWLVWTIGIIFLVLLLAAVIIVIRFFIKRKQTGIYDKSESDMSYSKHGETYSAHLSVSKPLTEDELVPA